MKKLSILLLTMVLALTLTGCGKDTLKEDVITSKTCNLKQEGLDQTFKYTATNGEIDKIDLTMVYDNAMFGVDSLNDLTTEQKEQIKANMLKTLGLESTTYEGLIINIDIQDQMTVVLNVDLKKADPEILKKVGLDFTGMEDMSLETAVKDMTSGGATCK